MSVLKNFIPSHGADKMVHRVILAAIFLLKACLESWPLVGIRKPACGGQPFQGLVRKSPCASAVCINNVAHVQHLFSFGEAGILIYGGKRVLT